jgi:hypothetical protein
VKSRRKTLAAVKRGEYGPVEFIAGPYKGALGLYDDDDSADRPGAVVLVNCKTFEQFAGSEKGANVVVVRHSSLRPIFDFGDFCRDEYLPSPETLSDEERRLVYGWLAGYTHARRLEKHPTPQEIAAELERFLKEAKPPNGGSAGNKFKLYLVKGGKKGKK